MEFPRAALIDLHVVRKVREKWRMWRRYVSVSKGETKTVNIFIMRVGCYETVVGLVISFMNSMTETHIIYTMV